MSLYTYDSLSIGGGLSAPAALPPARPQPEIDRQAVGSDGFLLPHVRSFQAVYNLFNRTYATKWDEAVRHGLADARAMRNDTYFRALLAERLDPLGHWDWTVEADADPLNPKDPFSEDKARIASMLEAECKATPDLMKFRRHLGWCTWFGRIANQVVYAPNPDAGLSWNPQVCRAWEPVDGDKLHYAWGDSDKGTELGHWLVLIDPSVRSRYGDETVITDRTTALRLRRPDWRQRFVIATHEIEDAPYEEAFAAGRAKGVGLRDFVFWGWWLRDEMLSWMVSLAEKAGTLGLLIFTYPAGNAAAKEQAETNAKNVNNRNALAVPVQPGTRPDEYGVKVVSLPTEGLRFLKEVTFDYFDKHFERLFIGQTLSSGTEGSGLGGSGVASLHEDTKFLRLKFDARNQEECLTSNYVLTLKQLNHRDAPGVYRWKYLLPDPKAKAKLEAITKAASLPGKKLAYKADEVRKLVGMSKPEEGDEIVGGEEPKPGQPGQPPPGGPETPPEGPPPAPDAPKPPPDANPGQSGKAPPELEAALAKAAAAGDTEAVARLNELANDPQRLAELLRELSEPPAGHTDVVVAAMFQAAADGDADAVAQLAEMGADPDGVTDLLEDMPDGGSIQTYAAVQKPGKFSSTQIDLTGEAAFRILLLARDVRNEDQGEDGREKQPHITVRYGLHTEDAAEVRSILEASPPVRYRLGKVSVFHGRDTGKPYDVLKVDVESPDLERLNRALAQLPHTDTHAGYHPHATVAYVKAGLGDTYAARMGELGIDGVADRAGFTNRQRLRTEFRLAGGGSSAALLTYAWTAGQTKTGKVKAVGAGEHAGRTVYGKRAEALLAAQGRQDRGEPAPVSAARRAQELKAQREPARQTAREAYEKAVADPASVKPEELAALAEHLNTLTRDELRERAREIRSGLGGLKSELVDRLLGRVRDERFGKIGPDGIPDRPAHGHVYTVKTDALLVDPTRFQFKLNTNASGVTKELQAVKTFNPEFAGVVSVWKDPTDGRTYVVNGHHRTELARRTGHPELAVRYLEAKDAREARAKGALINIAEGRGTAVDAAKFMRDMGVSPDDLHRHGVSLEGKLASDAATLTALNDKAFDRVARGDLDVNKALAVAKHLSDPQRQERLFGILDKREDEGKDLSSRTIEEMARLMADTPGVQTTEATLWGDETTEEDVFVERAELSAAVRVELARELGDFAAVASERRAGRVAGAGNVLNVDENRQRATQATAAKEMYDKLFKLKGPISDALNDGAVKLKQAKSKKERDRVRSETIESVRRAIADESAKLDKPADAAGKGGVDQGSSGGSGTEPPAPPGGNPADAGRGSERTSGVTEEAFKVTPGLSPKDAELERSSQAYARANYEEIRRKYLDGDGGSDAMGVPDGQGGYRSITLNTDEFRPHLPGYTGTNAGVVHEASSWLNGKMYTDALKSQKGKGNGRLMILAGGGGSGKGTATKGHFDLHQYPLVLDQVSDSLSKLEAKLDEAKANGFEPEYVFVDRPPADAWRGVVGRAARLRQKGKPARTVPIDRAIPANINARRTALELLKKRPDVSPNILDNRGTDGKKRLITDRDEAIKYLEEQLAAVPDEATLREQLHRETADRFHAGEIDEDIAAGLLGREAVDHEKASRQTQAATGMARGSGGESG